MEKDSLLIEYTNNIHQYLENPNDKMFNFFSKLGVIANEQNLSLKEVSQFNNDVIHNLIDKDLINKSKLNELFFVFSIFINSYTKHDERKKTDHQFKLMENIIENSIESIVVTDEKANIIFVNKAFENTTLYKRSDVIGKNPKILQSGKHDKVFYQNMWTLLAKNGSWQGRIINKRKNGVCYPEYLSISSLKNEYNNITNFVSFFSDISIEEQSNQIKNSEDRFKSINILVGGIAHHFNNILAGILGNLTLLKRTNHFDDDLSRIHNVEKLAHKAAIIVKNLQTFMHNRVIDIQEIPLHFFLKELINDAKDNAPKKVEIENKIDNNPFLIIGNLVEIQTVIENLLDNSYSALENTSLGKICIKLNLAEKNDQFLSRNKWARSLLYCKITIADNGMGINDDNMNNLFTPFYTTMDIGQGDGLGLSIVQGIVKSHNGLINIQSDINKGTTVDIYFPIINCRNKNIGIDLKFRSKSEIILIVNNNNNNFFSAILKNVLLLLGYNVLITDNCEKTIELFDNNNIALAILNASMDGIGLANIIRNINKSLPIFFTTSHDVKELFDNFRLIDNSRMFSLPLCFNGLCEHIFNVLNYEEI